MTATRHTMEDGSSESAATPAEAIPPSEIAGSLIGGLALDRCGVCDAELASDQRYCVECGTRRGRSTLPPAVSTDQRQDPGAAAAVDRRGAASTSRMLALVAIVTLLLALGVGILIGQSIAPTVHVSVGGGAPVSSSGTAGTGSSKGGAGKSTSGGSGAYGDSIGTTCTGNQAGCVNGKQTGNLFGGG